MHMSFWFDIVFHDFLFKGYTITSIGGLIATCLGLASLAIFLEFVKVLHASIYLKKATRNGCKSKKSADHEEASPISTSETQINYKNKLKMLTIQTSWYTIQDIIGYIVMLAVMTFNGYFTIAVIVGSALGYFIFGPWLMNIKLHAASVCSQQQKCAICIAKMEHLSLLASNSHNCETGSNDNTSSSLLDVAEGLASVMQSSSEEQIAVEVHTQELCT